MRVMAIPLPYIDRYIYPFIIQLPSEHLLSYQSFICPAFTRALAGHVHRLWGDVNLGVGEWSRWVGMGRAGMVPAAPSRVNLWRMAGLGWNGVGLGLMGHGPRETASDVFLAD